MTALALIALWAALGGLWRRIMGGWLGLGRAAVIAAGTILSLPLWLGLPWWGAALSTGALTLFFVTSFAPGTVFDNAQCFLRYGPFGTGYWLARLYWPRSWRVGGFIDGSNAVGEIFLGATVYAVVALAWTGVL